MLVIKRKKGESIKIGEDIYVKVVSVGDGAIKLAIDAPKNTKIIRTELIEEVVMENKNAKLTDKGLLDMVNKLR